MSSTAFADNRPAEELVPSQVHESEPPTESNLDLPARTMAEDERQDLPPTDTHADKDDPATVAASEELKHTTISDKGASPAYRGQVGARNGEDKAMADPARANTPDLEPTDAQDEEMRERISSPKKKRGRDQDDDDVKDFDDDKSDAPTSSADGSVVNGGRTTRSEPEKKRPRDASEDRNKAGDEAADLKEAAGAAPLDSTKINAEDSKPLKEAEPKQAATFGSGLNDKQQTSASAFASSGFASLASSSTSPFGSIGATKPSVFGGGAQQNTSGFGALAGAKSPSAISGAAPSSLGGLTTDKPTSGFSFGGGSTSAFGAPAGGSVFGAALGNGFGGGAGQKLSSFAAPGTETKVLGGKPAKPFGAPDSDEEDNSEEDESETGAGSDDEETSNAPAEEKKKAKMAKIHVEDGESGEATLLQLRAKLFALESKEAGWKERGVGTLKINVPESCASFDVNGAPIPGSFDASGLEDAEADSTAPRVARLIMRQENTHRVVLNTIVVRAMEFNDKPSTASAQILFTAFEGDKEPKPINMLLKMSEQNARLFRAEIESIKHEL